MDRIRSPMVRHNDWISILWAGVIGGLALLTAELVLVPLVLHQSLWGPPRMIAAILLGPTVLPPPATFDLGILAAALVMHFPLSIAYAFVLSRLLNRISPAPGIAVGAVFGFLLYLVNFYGFVAAFPWFAEARGGVSIVAHVLFGVSAAAVYEALHRARERRSGGTEAPAI